MEKLHQVDQRSWVSKKFKVSEFLDDWSKLLNDSLIVNAITEPEHLDEKPDFSSFLQSLLGNNLSTQEITQLDKTCRPETLCCGTEHLADDKITENSKLETINRLRSELNRREQDKIYRQVAFRRCRMLHVVGKTNFEVGARQVTRQSSTKAEIALVVHVFKPIGVLHQEQARIGSALHYKLQAEYAVLGSTPLIDLRRKILCVSDLLVPGDCSNDPCRPTKGLRTMKLYPSGSFYINGTFYNDMSNPASIDYSKVIIDWAETRPGIEKMNACNMEGVTFGDLELRLGYPYVYLHQGNCEHLFVFVDMRLLNIKKDSTNPQDYPMLLKMHPLQKRVVCALCHQCTARWCVTENSRLPDEVNFFCDECYLSYHYTKDEKPIGSFLARNYVDWTSIV